MPMSHASLSPVACYSIIRIDDDKHTSVTNSLGIRIGTDKLGKYKERFCNQVMAASNHIVFSGRDISMWIRVVCVAFMHLIID